MPSSRRLMTAGLLLTIGLVFAQATSQWIDFHFFNLRLRALDSDHHGSVFGGLSIFAEAAAATAIGLRAVSGRRSAWLPVAGVVGVLIVPRALMRYEAVFERYAVPILVVPLTVVFVALCALTCRDSRRVRCMVWGALVLLVCSFALHAVGPQSDGVGAAAFLTIDTWTYQAAGMLRHGAELAGWMFLATGMIAAASARREHTARGAPRRAHQPDPLAPA